MRPKEKWKKQFLTGCPGWEYNGLWRGIVLSQMQSVSWRDRAPLPLIGLFNAIYLYAYPACVTAGREQLRLIIWFLSGADQR